MAAAKGAHQAAHRAGMEEGASRALAQVTASAMGLVLAALGVLGLVFGAYSFGIGAGVTGQSFLVFEANGWHNLLLIVTGLFLIATAMKLASAVTGLSIVGLIYAAAAVWGLSTGSHVAFLIAVNTASSALHFVFAGIALVVALAAGVLGFLARRAQRSLPKGEHAATRADERGTAPARAQKRGRHPSNAGSGDSPRTATAGRVEGTLTEATTGEDRPGHDGFHGPARPSG